MAERRIGKGRNANRPMSISTVYFKIKYLRLLGYYIVSMTHIQIYNKIAVNLFKENDKKV